MVELNENEVMVLSTASVDITQALVAVGMLSPKDFEHPLTETTFAAIQTLVSKRLPLDELSLLQTIRTLRKDAGEEFMEAVRSICNAGMHTEDISYYAKQIKSASLSRRLAKVGRDIVALAGTGQDALDAIPQAQDMVLSLSRLYTDDTDFTGTEVAVEKVIQNMLHRMEHNAVLTGTPTGFQVFDERFTGGLQRGDLVILAARPSMGKTAFMVNIAENVCIHQNKPVYLFSLEMSREQLITRMMASLARVPANLIKNGQVPKEMLPAVQEAGKRIAAAPLFINDTSNMNTATMQMLIQKAMLEYGHFELICVDYLQLMESKGKKDSRNEEISGISRALKQLARTNNCPLLALSQLSRAVESRDNKRPQLSDLRDSGSIEQDADLVLFLYRDEYYKKEKSEMPGIGELIIAKQRNGPVGDVKLLWNPNLTKYSNMPAQPGW